MSEGSPFDLRRVSAFALRLAELDPNQGVEGFRAAFKKNGWPPGDKFEGFYEDYVVDGVPRCTLDLQLQYPFAVVDGCDEVDADPRTHDPRAEYDARFRALETTVSASLGAPEKKGDTSDKDRLLYAAWRRPDSFLVLEESAFDPQMGFQTLALLVPLAARAELPRMPISHQWRSRAVSDSAPPPAERK
jgi:hypothetical protein